MVTRQKLNFDINKPIQIQLLYNDCVTGENAYGQYFMYAVRCEGQEYSYFAPESVHEELKNLKAGDTAIITKLAAQRGNKLVTKYVVEHSTKEVSKPIVNQIKNTDINDDLETDTETNNSDGMYEKMLLSYKDAMRIQEEVGLVDISSVVRLAITLFIQRSR